MNAPVLRHPIAVLKERPYDGRLRVLEVDWAAERSPSIAEILDAQADVPQSFRDNCVARVNDEKVPRPMWRHVRPKPCRVRNGQVVDVVVTFALPIQSGGGGGGGGQKNPVATVATIAVLLAAAAVSGGAVGALVPGLAGVVGAGTVGAAVLGAGVAAGGSIERNALMVRP